MNGFQIRHYHTTADYYKQVCGCKRDILTYEIELADAISHLTLICGFKSVKRLIFTRLVISMLEASRRAAEQSYILIYHTRDLTKEVFTSSKFTV